MCRGSVNGGVLEGLPFANKKPTLVFYSYSFLCTFSSCCQSDISHQLHPSFHFWLQVKLKKLLAMQIFFWMQRIRPHLQFEYLLILWQMWITGNGNFKLYFSLVCSVIRLELNYNSFWIVLLRVICKIFIMSFSNCCK